MAKISKFKHQISNVFSHFIWPDSLARPGLNKETDILEFEFWQFIATLNNEPVYPV